MSWLDWLDGEPTTAQAEADPDPRGYGPFICNVPEQDVKKPEEAAWAGREYYDSLPWPLSLLGPHPEPEHEKEAGG